MHNCFQVPEIEDSELAERRSLWSESSLHPHEPMDEGTGLKWTDVCLYFILFVEKNDLLKERVHYSTDD